MPAAAAPEARLRPAAQPVRLRPHVLLGGAASGLVGLVVGVVTAWFVLSRVWSLLAEHGRELDREGFGGVQPLAVSDTFPYALTLAALSILAWAAAPLARAWWRALVVSVVAASAWTLAAWLSAGSFAVWVWWPGPWSPMNVEGERELSVSAALGPVVTAAVTTGIAIVSHRLTHRDGPEPAASTDPDGLTRAASWLLVGLVATLLLVSFVLVSNGHEGWEWGVLVVVAPVTWAAAAVVWRRPCTALLGVSVAALLVPLTLGEAGYDPTVSDLPYLLGAALGVAAVALAGAREPLARVVRSRVV